MQHAAAGVYDRQFDSGTCDGGKKQSEEAKKAEQHLCKHIMESEDNVRVWLKVEKQISLPGANMKDLYVYMKMLHMCPNDDRFQTVLKYFTPPAPKEDTLLEKLIMCIMGIVDFVQKNITIVSAVAAVLFPVFLPILTRILAWAFRTIPWLEQCLAPILPESLAAPLKKHIDESHPTEEGAEEGAEEEADELNAGNTMPQNHNGAENLRQRAARSPPAE